MTTKRAFLFPGQGSQYIGMGRDFVEEFPQAKEIFQQVDDVCEKPISRLCFEGPMDELTLTVNLQPAITAVNLVCLTVLQQKEVSPGVSAGHSLGEYAALTAAHVISTSDALRLVKKRGELMHRESVLNPGAMAAVLGMDISEVMQVAASVAKTGVLSVANHNTAEQVVISGETGLIARVVDIIKERGKKTIPLKVSGAWHCALMENAVDEFRQFMEEIPFSRPETPVLFNATAGTEDDPEKIKDIMAQQLISPVRWYDIIQNMITDGVQAFVEVGPKNVLTGLMKKIASPQDPVEYFHVDDMKSLNDFLAAKG